MAGPKRLPRLEDHYLIEYVATPDYCPAAGLVAYVVARAQRDRYVQQVMVLDLTMGETRRISAGGDVENSPRLSPDGRYLAFCSNATGDPQVWVADLREGGLRRLTSLRYGASNPVWSPRGDRIAFLGPVFEHDDPEQVHQMRDPEQVAALERQRRDQPVVIEDYGYKSDDAMGFTQVVPPTHVWVVGLDGERPRRLTDGSKRHVMPVWSPDGSTILFASNREREASDFLGLDLFTVPSGGGEIRRLTSDLFVAYYPKKIVPRFTPDGRCVIFGALDPERGGVPVSHLYRVPVEGGEAVRLFGDEAPCDGATRFLYNGSWGEAYETVQVSEDGRYVYFIAGWHGSGNIYRVPVDGEGGVEPVTRGPQNFSSLTPPHDGKCVVLRCDATSFDDIYMLDLATGDLEPLTRHNQWLDEVALSDMEELWIDTLDGKARVQGWVLKPQGLQPGERCPAVLYIHGGPSTFYGYALNYEYQCLAAAGIAVMLVNPRGSTGYGREYSTLSYAFDGTAYYDLLQFVDEAVRRFDWIDGDRLGVCGGSYGGYMTIWMVAHSRRFKAAAAHRPPVNELISYGSGDMGANGRSRQFASYTEFMLSLLEKSPVIHSDKINIPFLILHSTQDMRCPVEGAHQLYTALKDQHPDLPVRLVLFPDSNHMLAMSGPMYLRLLHYEENLRWFVKHLGVDGKAVPAAWA